jgi:hypothetical protein
MTEETKDLHVDTEGNVVEPVQQAPEPETPPAAPEADERLTDNDTDEEEGHAEETAEEAEERKERNRARRAESKQRRKDYVESLKRELSARDRIINEMNQRLSTVERKSTGSEMAQLDNAEKQAIQAYNHFKDINAKAIEQANGQIAIEAQEKMFEARKRYEQLQGIKQAMTQRQAAPQPLDPRLVNHAQEWMQKNAWYDPNGKDQDSAVTLTIDNRLAQEGWDPTTPEYWKELESRVKRYLPHRAKTGYNTPSGNRNAPPPVSGSGRESTSSKGTYRLSADRVQALKSANLWDDPKQRAEAVKRFQEYDRNNERTG